MPLTEIVATKQDIANLEVKIEKVSSDLKVKIEKVQADLEVKIERVRTDLIR
ncbi:hypothetical protein [Thermodesulfovibrio sp. 3462-1]|jgi:hypothetical protein|uniref:DUF1640 domain-containing protein n=1 Tax=Thermodesulfovibrio obliviosus TaxID=3118332 RepID=A0AAU8H3T4_9BACT